MLYDADALQDCPPDYFNPEYWAQTGGLHGQAVEGKGSTYFVRHGDDAWALRHYCRGGLIARFVRDSYLWLGLERTRPWCEWHVLARLSEQGLPVPKPVAAQVRRRGWRYRADLIMQRIDQASTWQEEMLQGTLETADWLGLGKMIRRFHDAGLYHHDLNVNNILRQQDGSLYLIDFDRARLRRHGSWKQANLSRLRRSIDKLCGKQPGVAFSERCWDQLLQGYAAL